MPSWFCGENSKFVLLNMVSRLFGKLMNFIHSYLFVKHSITLFTPHDPMGVP